MNGYSQGPVRNSTARNCSTNAATMKMEISLILPGGGSATLAAGIQAISRSWTKSRCGGTRGNGPLGLAPVIIGQIEPQAASPMRVGGYVSYTRAVANG